MIFLIGAKQVKKSFFLINIEQNKGQKFNFGLYKQSINPPTYDCILLSFFYFN